VQPLWLLEELRQYPPDCLVMFVDVDMLWQAGWQEIHRKYTEVLKRPRILMGAECESFLLSCQAASWLCGRAAPVTVVAWRVVWCSGACWPFVTWGDHATCLDEYPPAPTKYRFVNSGTVIGQVTHRTGFTLRLRPMVSCGLWLGSRAADLIPMYEAQLALAHNEVQPKVDDQGPATRVYLARRHQMGIQLDHFSQISHQMFEVSE
jgi:hypothetical protein